MNPDLQKARQHYDALPPNVKERATAKHLLAAIQIAKKALDDLKTCRELCDAIRSSESDLRERLESAPPI